ncbi:Pre-mRNA cleavage complex II protein Clp1, partial [Reticulomyxa filosa]
MFVGRTVGTKHLASSWRVIVSSLTSSLPLRRWQTCTVLPHGQVDVDVNEGDDTISCRLLCGDAEVQGYPLEYGHEYKLQNGGFGIHSQQGCKLEISGNFKPCIMREGRELPMSRYLELHRDLEAKRKISIDKQLSQRSKGKEKEKGKSEIAILRQFETKLEEMGPRVLIVGHTDTGKSTLCKLLCNYALREDAQGTPVLIDLDNGQSMISVPGTVGGAVIDQLISPFQSRVNPKDPFIYFFGQSSPTHLPKPLTATVD